MNLLDDARIVRLLLGLALIVALAACSGPGLAPGLSVDNPVVHRWPGIGSGYLEIANGDATPDRLVRVESLFAESVELHETVTDGDVMKMQAAPQAGFEIPAHGRLILKRGGKHIMMLKLRVPDDAVSIPLRLVFERHPSLEVQAEIRDGS